MTRIMFPYTQLISKWTDNFVGGRDMDVGFKKDIWSVMEDFSETPGDKYLNKMKYVMFVDTVGSNQVTR